MSGTSRWLLMPPPDSARSLLFGFPYAGGGASLYRSWPDRIGDAWICPLQPPGREHRFGEDPLRTVPEFASSVADYLQRYADREYAFFGHCGGVPLELATTLEMQDRGLSLPTRVFASGWGPPHRRLYGQLNYVDLASADMGALVAELFRKLGVVVRDDLVEVAAKTLRVDLVMHRPHLYDAKRMLPVPATVIGWSGDDVVPPTVTCTGWDEVANARYEVLAGAHFAFIECPGHLTELLIRDMTADRNQLVDTASEV